MTGGARSGHLGEEELDARAEQKKNTRQDNKTMALPAGPCRLVAQHAHALACRDAEAFRDVDEAIAELEREEEEAKAEVEIEREEEIRHEIDRSGKGDGAKRRVLEASGRDCAGRQVYG